MEAVDPGDFLARVIMHIPQPRRHLVRYYGWYSNVSRGKRRNAEREYAKPVSAVDGPPSSPTARAAARVGRALRRSWAQLIKRIYEVDPLVCPSCGSEMKVIAFITEHEVVGAILRHLEGKESQGARAPPN